MAAQIIYMVVLMIFLWSKKLIRLIVSKMKDRKLPRIESRHRKIKEFGPEKCIGKT